MAEDQIQKIVEQLYETEGLTDALTDEPAQILLGWGEQQLRNLGATQSDPAELDSAARQLQRVIRSINRLVGQQADLSETQMVQRLLRLTEQALQLGLQKSIFQAQASSTDREEDHQS